MKKKMLRFLFVLFGLLFLFIPITVTFLFGQVEFNQIIFHISLMDGMKEFFQLFYLPLILFCLLFCGLFILILKLNLKLGILMTFCVIMFGFFCYQIGFFSYSWYYIFKNDSLFLKKNYVAPYSQTYVFPEHKKNVVLIVMESMEKTFAILPQENLIPNLNMLQMENQSFAGFSQAKGSLFTTAGLVSMMSAVPLWSDIKENGIDKLETLSPSFVNILQKNGYNTVFLSSCNIDFGGVDRYTKAHGYTRSLGGSDFLKLGKTEPVYAPLEKMNTFGYNDADLYRIGQFELDKLSAENKPFFLTLMTINTHIPDGFLSSSCVQKNQTMENSIRCADEMVYNFITWLKHQKYYKDTVVIIVGDHLQRERYMTKKLNKHHREIITIFMNSAIPDSKRAFRPYTHFDLAPTILESMGIQFKSRRFGLGTSLYSPVETLLEKINLLELNEELSRTLKLYNYSIK